MEIIHSSCKDEDILREQEILNYMYINRNTFSEEERLIQSQKLDKLMNERKSTFF